MSSNAVPNCFKSATTVEILENKCNFEIRNFKTKYQWAKLKIPALKEVLKAYKQVHPTAALPYLSSVKKDTLLNYIGILLYKPEYQSQFDFLTGIYWFKLFSIRHSIESKQQ